MDVFLFLQFSKGSQADMRFQYFLLFLIYIATQIKLFYVTPPDTKIKLFFTLQRQAPKLNFLFVLLYIVKLLNLTFFRLHCQAPKLNFFFFTLHRQAHKLNFLFTLHRQTLKLNVFTLHHQAHQHLSALCLLFLYIYIIHSVYTK